MERKIKFRGLRTDGKGWAYGYLMGSILLDKENDYFIIADFLSEQLIPVITETIGQYTGLKDRDGADVYEGDILVDFYYDELPIIIQFIGGCFVGIQDTKEIKNRNWLSFKIIGNIHEPTPHNLT